MDSSPSWLGGDPKFTELDAQVFPPPGATGVGPPSTHQHTYTVIRGIITVYPARFVSQFRVSLNIFRYRLRETMSVTNEVVDEVERPDEPEERVCALEGCDNPLPVPAVDEQGRRKGGRPSSYCCKAHADAASRQRRAVQAAAVLDPLVELRRCAEAFGAVTEPVLDSLHAMAQRLDAADEAAVAQVRQADEQASAARAEAEDALRRAEQAERARDRALAQVRDAQSARTEAEKAAQQAMAAAEQTQRDAWAQVAQHERARGAAESAATASAQARDELSRQLRETRSQVDELVAARARLTERADDVENRFRELSTAHTVATERLEAATARAEATQSSLDHARREVTEARDEATAHRAELDQIRAQLAEERTARQLAEAGREHAQAAHTEAARRVAELGDQLDQTHARLDRLLAAAAAGAEAAEDERVAEDTDLIDTSREEAPG
jgi:chromosome segregation ATPase